MRGQCDSSPWTPEAALGERPSSCLPRAGHTPWEARPITPWLAR